MAHQSAGWGILAHWSVRMQGADCGAACVRHARHAWRGRGSRRTHTQSTSLQTAAQNEGTCGSWGSAAGGCTLRRRGGRRTATAAPACPPRCSARSPRGNRCDHGKGRELRPTMLLLRPTVLLLLLLQGSEGAAAHRHVSLFTRISRAAATTSAETTFLLLPRACGWVGVRARAGARS